MSNKKRNRRRARRPSKMSPIRGIAIGVAVSIGSALLLALLFAAIIGSTADPARLTTPAALAALYIACFAGSLCATQLCGGYRPAGLICGGMIWLGLLLVSLAVPGGTDWGSVGLHSLCTVFSAAGTLPRAR